MRENESNAITRSALLSPPTQLDPQKAHPFLLIIIIVFIPQINNGLILLYKNILSPFILFILSTWAITHIHLFPSLLSTNSLFFIWSFSLCLSLIFFAALPLTSPKTWPSFLIIFYHFNWLFSLFTRHTNCLTPYYSTLINPYSLLSTLFYCHYQHHNIYIPHLQLYFSRTFTHLLNYSPLVTLLYYIKIVVLFISELVDFFVINFSLFQDEEKTLPNSSSSFLILRENNSGKQIIDMVYICTIAFERVLL